MLLAFHGISDFDGLHSGKYDEAVQFYAFDIVALDRDDLRKLWLLCKQHLARLLKRRPKGTSLGPFEQREIGPDLSRAACSWGLEGIV